MKKTIAVAALALAVSFGSIACKKKVSDAELIKGIKGGDTEFFEQLFQRYRFLNK